MMTEITDRKDVASAVAWLAYDRECAMCRRGASRWRGVLARRGVKVVALQAMWVRRRLRLSAGEVPDEIKLMFTDGPVLGGADAMVALAGRIWWAWPVAVLARVPGVMPLLRCIYRAIARRRHCFNGACRVGRAERSTETG